MKLSIPAICLFAVVSCAQIPATYSRNAPLPLPARYDSTPYPTPEVRQSLLNLFQNSDLTAVTQRALQNNPQIASSSARLSEVGFNLESTKAPLFPFLSGNSSIGTSRASSTSIDTIELGLDASWEIDVWNRIHNSVVAAQSDQAAAAADLAAIRQSIAAQTMQAWFNTVATNKLVDITQRQVDSLAAAERLVSRRFEAGTSSLADLELTRTDHQNIKADLEARIDERDRATHLLKVLMGDYPDSAITRTTIWPNLHRSVPAGVPSDILRKRPDIDAAYQRIRAADARIHVAHADLFPTFSLTASSGRSGSKLSDLVRSGGSAWSLFGGLTAPLFDGGERKAELGATGKRAEQAYQDYRSVVLTALREVEDALNSENYLAREEKSRLAALAAARSAEARSSRDYEAGLTDLLTFLEIQRRVFTTEEQAINLHLTRLNNRVSLALALGKGI